MSQGTDIRGRKLNPRYKLNGIGVFAKTYGFSRYYVWLVIHGRRNNPDLLESWHRFVAEDLAAFIFVNKLTGIKRPDRTRKEMANTKRRAKLKAYHASGAAQVWRGKRRQGICKKLLHTLAGKEQAS